jgi:hypothetical protein
MTRKDENQVKSAREASMEKEGENPTHFSPEAARMEASMSQDELRKKATKPSSGSTKRSSTSKI